MALQKRKTSGSSVRSPGSRRNRAPCRKALSPGSGVSDDAGQQMESMSGSKQNTFSERLSDARAAKQAMAARFRARRGLDDPAVAARRAARAAVSAAHDVRVAERAAQRAAEIDRIAA